MCSALCVSMFLWDWWDGFDTLRPLSVGCLFVDDKFSDELVAVFFFAHRDQKPWVSSSHVGSADM